MEREEQVLPWTRRRERGSKAVKEDNGGSRDTHETDTRYPVTGHPTRM